MTALHQGGVPKAARTILQAIEQTARRRALDVTAARRSRWQRSPKWERILSAIEDAPGPSLNALGFAIEQTWLCRMRVRIAIEGQRLGLDAADPGIVEVYAAQMRFDLLFFRQYRKQRDKLICAFRHSL